jgi:hypothetical protein
MNQLERMKRVFIVFLLIISQAVLCQNKFSFTENGLAPSQITTKVNGYTKTELQELTLSWIRERLKYSTAKVDGEFIILTVVKGNFIEVKKSYYNVKYSAKISFDKGRFTLEPMDVFTKLNSKYDMGWQPFDLKDGSAFFKRGKPIKKTKVYLKKIPELFNKLNADLLRFLK